MCSAYYHVGNGEGGNFLPVPEHDQTKVAYIWEIPLIAVGILYNVYTSLNIQDYRIVCYSLYLLWCWFLIILCKAIIDAK